MPLDGAKTRGQIGVGSARSAAHHAAYTSQLAIVVTARGPRAIADPFFAFSRPHASRRQHYTWNLDRAVDAFFDGSWQNALVDAAEAKALAESGASPPSPPFATTGGVQNLASDDDADYVPSPPGFDKQDDDYHYVDDDDLEDQMLAAAVDESADGRREPPRRDQGGTGAASAPIMLDDEDDEIGDVRHGSETPRNSSTSLRNGRLGIAPNFVTAKAPAALANFMASRSLLFSAIATANAGRTSGANSTASIRRGNGSRPDAKARGAGLGDRWRRAHER